MEARVMGHPHAFQSRPDFDGSRPTVTRTSVERATLNRREALRRHVGIARLMQQGLTRFEAEEQFELRLGRKMP
jgi:hypothetical protein